jgi:DNA polymerase III epsilon subunit family exonuclease
MDIAAIHVLDGEIIDTFSSLVNPKQAIPPFIQEMTGINDDLVKTAPDEREVLTEYLNFINKPNSVFVAHNANFDYFFIKNALLRNFNRFTDEDVLCTVKLARKLLPITKKVNLNALTEYFNIPIFMRHRALGDAFATARALIKMLHILKLEHGIDTFNKVKEFKRKPRRKYKINNPLKDSLIKKIEDLPYCQGVFQLYAEDNELIYQDCADIVKTKLESFFDPDYLSSDKVKKIIDHTTHFSYKETATSLHSKLALGAEHLQSQNLSLFDAPKDVGNVIYIDPNNSTGKTVSIFLFKNGLLADFIELGKNANTNIIESIIAEVYSNDRPITPHTNEAADKEIIRKWLSQEPDLGNKFQITEDITGVLASIKNYIRSCY